METQVFESVLTLLSEEQKISNQVIGELTEKVTVLAGKVAAFEEKQEKLKIIAPPADTAPLEKIAQNYFLEFCRIVEAQPKKVVRQFRFLLFPETNTDYYYKLIFGRLIPWGGLFVVAAFLISLSTHYVDRSTDLRERQYRYEVYQETLNRADTILTKTDRQKLHELFKKVQKENQ